MSRADRVTVIPNGVVADRFTPTDAEGRAQARRDLSLDEQRFTLVYVGALVPEKGVDLAIEAVARVPAAQLLVAGDGPEASTLRALAARVAPDRVVFAPPGHRSDRTRIEPPTPSCWRAAAATACPRCSSKRA